MNRVHYRKVKLLQKINHLQVGHPPPPCLNQIVSLEVQGRREELGMAFIKPSSQVFTQAFYN